MSAIFDSARKQSDFGNGRYVRNVIENAQMAQASRLLAMDFDAVSVADVATVRPEDISLPAEEETSPVIRIGFCA